MVLSAQRLLLLLNQYHRVRNSVTHCEKVDCSVSGLSGIVFPLHHGTDEVDLNVGHGLRFRHSPGLVAPTRLVVVEEEGLSVRALSLGVSLACLNQ
jgi:hypothetical protein